MPPNLWAKERLSDAKCAAPHQFGQGCNEDDPGVGQRADSVCHFVAGHPAAQLKIHRHELRTKVEGQADRVVPGCRDSQNFVAHFDQQLLKVGGNDLLVLND
ncbi:MAG: hypothetical protein ABJC09_13645 [Terriglobia bacterium]